MKPTQAYGIQLVIRSNNDKNNQTIYARIVDSKLSDDMETLKLKLESPKLSYIKTTKRIYSVLRIKTMYFCCTNTTFFHYFCSIHKSFFDIFAHLFNQNGKTFSKIISKTISGSVAV